ncbi:uncharacterized protein [Typha latifolia]|uniref:uncharacterized protein n=1 Tax=Typha latifolia TaxID=4733 RepID=UPI003C2D4DD1
MWVVWKQRNAKVHELEANRPRAIVRGIIQMALDYASKNGKASEQRERLSVCWAMPDRGWLKLNSDGCYSPQCYRAGVGIILRNDQGTHMKIAWEPCPSVSTLYAKVWAIRFGLRLISTNCKLVVKTDSLEVVRLLCMEAAYPWEVGI